MNLHHLETWQISVFAGAALLLIALVAWLFFRRRPTAEELERERRRFLVQSGRLVDGMVLDAYEFEGTDGRTLTMLLYNYRIAGVDYECSQDVTLVPAVGNLEDIRAGFPCTVRYQPGSPQNSIVVAEEWNGMRAGLPVLPAYEDPEPVDTSHLKAESQD